ncbi:hypothetical protein SLEP1_g39021 [Rubroshorea leprosula]|uniref:Uncharacterized protein n=1 Tax=Rubroshorea leprosula TaxID=152421 RepID=A0AAV5KZM8_9ROSI|nr:hypothetical protein SLEP1_g39021 [Rubroshorea leprosula]
MFIESIYVMFIYDTDEAVQHGRAVFDGTDSLLPEVKEHIFWSVLEWRPSKHALGLNLPVLN